MKHALVMHTKIPITDWQKTHHWTCLPTCVHFLVASYPTWSNVQVSQQTVSFSDWNSNIAKCLIYAQQNTTMCTQMIVNKTKWMVSKTIVVPLGIHHLIIPSNSIHFFAIFTCHMPSMKNLFQSAKDNAQAYVYERVSRKSTAICRVRQPVGLFPHYLLDKLTFDLTFCKCMGWRQLAGDWQSRSQIKARVRVYEVEQLLAYIVMRSAWLWSSIKDSILALTASETESILAIQLYQCMKSEGLMTSSLGTTEWSQPTAACCIIAICIRNWWITSTSPPTTEAFTVTYRIYTSDWLT